MGLCKDDTMTLDRLIESLNITHDTARRWCGKTPRQWRRYRCGATPFPVPLRQLITLRAGFLEELSPAWAVGLCEQSAWVRALASPAL